MSERSPAEMESPNRSLQKRVALLERVIVGNVLIVAVVLLAGAAKPGPNDVVADKIVARALEIVDDDGHVRASLRTSADSGVALLLTDVDHSNSVFINSGSGHQMLYFRQDKKARILIGTSKDRVPGISLYDPDGHERISQSIGLTKVGERLQPMPGILLRDQYGSARMMFAIDFDEPLATIGETLLPGSSEKRVQLCGQVPLPPALREICGGSSQSEQPR